MQKGEYYFAKTIADLLQQINAIPNARIVGGCTLDAFMKQSAHDYDAEDTDKNIFISTRGIKELSQIIKHERYIDCGPGVTLSALLEHGGSHIPSVLAQAAQSIANPFVRNLATIGGNVAGKKQTSPSRYLTLYSPLLALDAKVEFKSRVDTRFVPIAAFDGVPREYILSNIRIPLDDWDVAVFRRLPNTKEELPGSTFTFLASTEKNLISNARLAFTGNIAFRSIELENKAIGMRLPLSQKDADFLAEAAASLFKEAANEKESDQTLSRFEYLVRYSLGLLV